jgi:hypothetical protein
MSRTLTRTERTPEKAAASRPVGGWRRIRSGGVGIGALVGLSIVAAVVGLVQAGLIVRGPAAGPPEAHAALDGMQAEVTKAQWLSHDDMDPAFSQPSGTTGPAGYAMPDAMMPGMPAEGHSRLLIQLNLSNDAGKARAVEPVTEFILHDEQGGNWPAQGDTFGGFSRLNPSSGVTGGVFFDVPTNGAGQHQWVLEWTRGGKTTRLAVDSQGSPTQHSH